MELFGRIFFYFILLFDLESASGWAIVDYSGHIDGYITNYMSKKNKET